MSDTGMRLLLASTIDIAAAGILAFAAFHLAVSVVPCSDLGECVVLGPSVVILILAVLVLYFGASVALLGATFGQYVANRLGSQSHGL